MNTRTFTSTNSMNHLFSIPNKIKLEVNNSPPTNVSTVLKKIEKRAGSNIGIFNFGS